MVELSDAEEHVEEVEREGTDDVGWPVFYVHRYTITDCAQCGRVETPGWPE